MAIRLSGMISGLDSDAIIKELMSAQAGKKTKIEQNKEKLEWKKEKWDDLNTKMYSMYTEQLSKMKLQGNYLTKKVTSSNDSKVTATASNATNGSYSLEVKNLASTQYITGADISSKDLKKTSTMSDAGFSATTITLNFGKDLDNEKTIDVTDDTTIDELVTKFKEAGLNASFDEKSGRFFLSAKESGEAGKFTMTANESGSVGLAALGLGEITEELANGGQTAPTSDTMAVVAAKDASVILNGATLTSSTNNISVGGLSIELKGSTMEGEVINLTVGSDVDSVYDGIKGFVDKYNELMKEMYDKYNAPSSRKYAMLTDEDKEAMTDEQVKLWEDRIKDSTLRRDSTLSSLMSAFRSTLSETVDVDGEKFSLSTFGIVTGDYNERGQLHINGNEGDALYAGKTDSLRKMLTEDPEKSAKALSKLFSNLYDTMTKKMSASSISSALTFYNDKQIQSQIDDYTKQVDKWETKLTELEDRYYKQFAFMEKSMAQMQEKQNQMAGMLGM